MQISDMRALRALRPHSNQFRLRTRNLLPPSLPFPGLRRKEPQFLTHFRFFHSLKPLSSRESTAFSSTSVVNPISDQAPGAWSYRATGANWGTDEEDEDARAQVGSSNHGASRNADLGHVLFNNNSGKKKGKGRIEWVCSNCGNTYGQWWGTCSACKYVGTIKQFSVASEDVEVVRSRANISGFAVSENAMMGAWLPATESQSRTRPVRLRDVSRSINEMQWRIPLLGYGNVG